MILSFTSAAATFTLDYNLICTGCALDAIPFYRSTTTADISIVSQPPADVPIPGSAALLALGGAMFGLRSLRRKV
jgi:hypothetical protein